LPFKRNLDAGEREAIMLAQAAKAQALLIDEADGREEARELGLKVIGTLGILKEAHERGLLNLREAITKLQATNYQIAPSILKSILESV
jgi:predicted nucleic acid-binding protein